MVLCYKIAFNSALNGCCIIPGYPALFKYEKLNQKKNLISKTVGGKMKAKEPVGDSAEIPDSIKSQLAELDSELLQVCT